MSDMSVELTRTQAAAYAAEITRQMLGRNTIPLSERDGLIGMLQAYYGPAQRQGLSLVTLAAAYRERQHTSRHPVSLHGFEQYLLVELHLTASSRG